MNIELTHQQQSVIWIHKCCNYRLDIYPRYLWMSTQQCPILLKQCVQIYQLVEINYDKNTISAQYVFLITHMFDCLASSAVSPAALGNCLLTRDCWTSLSSDWKNNWRENFHQQYTKSTYTGTHSKIGWMPPRSFWKKFDSPTNKAHKIP